MQYEMIREIFNKCANNQMRDVFVEEIETDDPKRYVEEYLEGKADEIEENVLKNGDVIIDVNVSGLRQRFSFTPID
ncbi:MAG: hypothetical protein IJJ48_02100 [Firmicutes bacterium]|jgi:hypothetical protein|nr:hypothetical protein [Bacillota bacterium]